MSASVEPVRRIAVELIAAAADPRSRKPLYAFWPEGDPVPVLRRLDRATVESTHDFLLGGMVAVHGALSAHAARCVGVLLPVRTLWGELAVCPELDAEALAIVAAETDGDLAASVGIACPIHLLPAGWQSATARTAWLARALRDSVVRAPLWD
jgi:hypothetical protein